MSRKPRFKLLIKRVRLNPEQAVLTCNCFWVGAQLIMAPAHYAGPGSVWSCLGKAHSNYTTCMSEDSSYRWSGNATTSSVSSS